MPVAHPLNGAETADTAMRNSHEPRGAARKRVIDVALAGEMGRLPEPTRREIGEKLDQIFRLLTVDPF